MTLYRSGVRKEHAARNWMYETGALLVTRSAGSKGLVDLVGVFERRVDLVQVKYTGRPGMTWKDANWKKLAALVLPENVFAVAFVYRRGVSVPEVYIA